MQSLHVDGGTFCFNIDDLPADHASGAEASATSGHVQGGCGAHPLNQGGTGQGLEGTRRERIPGEDRHRFAVNLVACGLASPKIVVVHRREVVVNQGVGVDDSRAMAASRTS